MQQAADRGVVAGGIHGTSVVRWRVRWQELSGQAPLDDPEVVHGDTGSQRGPQPLPLGGADAVGPGPFQLMEADRPFAPGDDFEQACQRRPGWVRRCVSGAAASHSDAARHAARRDICE